MTIIDHLSLGVSDIAAAKEFYSKTLGPIGIDCIAHGPDFAAFGRDRVGFLVMLPFNGRPASAGNGCHIGFAAPSREAVKAAHKAGLAAGASDEGGPGPRDNYPMPGVYSAYLRDPWGNKIEIVHGGFSA